MIRLVVLMMRSVIQDMMFLLKEIVYTLLINIYIYRHMYASKVFDNDHQGLVGEAAHNLQEFFRSVYKRVYCFYFCQFDILLR